MDAARRIYEQLDSDEKPVGLSLLSGSAEGEMLSTQVLDDQPGVIRLLIPNQSDVMQQGERLMAENAVNLQP